MSQIEWTDATWNPVVGCSRVSAGCDHCYAAKMAHRFNHSHYEGVTTRAATGTDWTGLLNRAPAHIVEKPLRATRPTVFFVNSMSDMFHENMPDAWLVEFFGIMNQADQHTFQVLTKRPSRAVKKTRELGLKWTSNIWAGTSIDTENFALARARELMKLPADVRFASCEPLLTALPSLPIPDLDWIIAGGESGNERDIRPADANWFRDLRDRCRSAGVPFFFKQWGAYGQDGIRRSKAANGHRLDGEEIFEMPADAYDRLPAPDPRWTRIAPRAEHTPTERFLASGPLYVAGGEITNSDEDFILSKLRRDRDTYQNPNRFLMTEDERRARLEAEEAEARWLSLLSPENRSSEKLARKD